MRHPPADLTPPTIAALGAALAKSRTVRIVGTQSLATRTAPPPPSALVVSIEALTQLEIEPPDLIARVEAGVRLADLRHCLWEQGLVWPVERIEPNGTVGGLIASGRGSAVRAADAPARRWILGATIVLASGETIQAGGATVKFSAGYGLTHAMWGSGGRLGTLAAVTLRLRQAVAGDAAVPDAGPSLAQVIESPYEVRAEELPARMARARVGGHGGQTAASRQRRHRPRADRLSQPGSGGGRGDRDPAPGRLGRHRPAGGGSGAGIRCLGAAQRRPGPRAAACLTGPGAANTTAGGSRTAPTPAGAAAARLY